MQITYDPGEKQKITIGNKTIIDELTGATPAVSFHKGALWMAWVGWKNQNLNIARLDKQSDGRYIENILTKQVLASTSDRAPALVSDGTRLYMAFVGVGNHQVNIVSSVNGDDFQHASKNTLLSESSEGPELAVLNGKLYIGFCGVNGSDYSVIGPASVESSGKVDFNASDKKTFPFQLHDSIVGMCAYNNHLVFVIPDVGDVLRLYRWQPGQALPATSYANLSVNGGYVRCAAAAHSSSPGNLWVSSFFTTGKVTSEANDPMNNDEPDIPLYNEFYWYIYRVVDNPQGSADIQGAASLAGDNPEGFGPLAVSDDGSAVIIAWRGTDNPSHANVGTIPSDLTGS